MRSHHKFGLIVINASAVDPFKKQYNSMQGYFFFQSVSLSKCNLVVCSIAMVLILFDLRHLAKDNFFKN